jgi:hypothetical protein
MAGWQFDAVGTVQSGAPVNVIARQNSDFGLLYVRPDLNAGSPVWIVDPRAPSGRRLNPDAFSVSGEVRQGTFGRNSLRSSWIRQIDFACSRTLTVHALSIQLRLEAFNVLNVPNFGPPTSEIGDPQFGQVTRSYAESLGTGTLSRGGLTPVEQVGGPRAIRLLIRVRM